MIVNASLDSMTTQTPVSPAMWDEIDVQAHRVLHRACATGIRLATAESCTGGLLASTLTDIQGFSHAFECSFVVYTDRAKMQLLGVPRDAIRDYTAVSEQVARAMAEGGLARSNADFCIVITGYTDAADPQVQAGLVHFALATNRSATTHRKCEYGDQGRSGVRIACLRTALQMLTTELERN